MRRIRALLGEAPWLLLEEDTRTLHIVDPAQLSDDERVAKPEELVELLGQRVQDPVAYVRLELSRQAEDFVLRMLRKSRGGKRSLGERWGNRLT